MLLRMLTGSVRSCRWDFIQTTELSSLHRVTNRRTDPPIVHCCCPRDLGLGSPRNRSREVYESFVSQARSCLLYTLTTAVSSLNRANTEERQYDMACVSSGT